MAKEKKGTKRSIYHAAPSAFMETAASMIVVLRIPLPLYLGYNAVCVTTAITQEV